MELGASEAQPLSDIAAEACKRFNMPAVYVAVATTKGIQFGVGGYRINEPNLKILASSKDRVTTASITKPFTAMVAMALHEKNILPMGRTFSKLFPETTGFIDPGFGDATPLRLMTHQCGLPNATGDEILTKTVPSGAERFALSGAPLDRYKYLLRLLQFPPTATKGKYTYSSPGYIVLAAMEERAARSKFEDLVSKYVFRPLGLKSAAVGLPGTPGKTDQPTYYPYKNGIPGPSFPGNPQNDQSALNSSTGRIVLTIDDLARFGWAFVAGAEGVGLGLLPSTYKICITPDREVPTRTPVWEVVDRNYVGRVLEHTGQNGDQRGFWSNSLIIVSPSKKLVVAIMSNRGEAWDGLFFARDEILKNFLKLK